MLWGREPSKSKAECGAEDAYPKKDEDDDQVKRAQKNYGNEEGKLGWYW